MPVAALTTLGCKVNQYETEKIAEDFANAGFVLTDFDAPADVYVINSCSVTAAADKKSRYLARKASRTNPNAIVVMTGCHSQQVLDHGEKADANGEEGREHEAESGIFFMPSGGAYDLHRGRTEQPHGYRADEDGHGVLRHVPKKAERHAGQHGMREGVTHE